MAPEWTASGKRVSHTDIWRKIQRWIRKFEGAADRVLEIRHVRAHTGNVGNEKADELAKKGSKLRHELMVDSAKEGWFEWALETYWKNRQME